MGATRLLVAGSPASFTGRVREPEGGGASLTLPSSGDTVKNTGQPRTKGPPPFRPGLFLYPKEDEKWESTNSTPSERPADTRASAPAPRAHRKSPCRNRSTTGSTSTYRTCNAPALRSGQ